MGASHRLDLTADVTHLLIGEIKTPKYKYVARERPDVTVLYPEWVEEVRKLWMQGGDTDIRALEEQWRLPTFTGLSICATGFEDGESHCRILSHARSGLTVSKGRSETTSEACRFAMAPNSARTSPETSPISWRGTRKAKSTNMRPSGTSSLSLDSGLQTVWSVA